MRKVLLVLFLLACGLQLTVCAQEGVAGMKKAVMIIAQKDFRDEELLEPKAILEKNGIEVKVASTTLSEVKGVLGARVSPDILVGDVKIKDFDAVVFIGGAGSAQYWDDPTAHKLAQQALQANKIVAAICIAPVTLTRAGILKGKNATVWSSEAGQLKTAGAKYTGANVERDANIITAAGPFAAKEFGQELVKALK